MRNENGHIEEGGTSEKIPTVSRILEDIKTCEEAVQRLRDYHSRLRAAADECIRICEIRDEFLRGAK